METKHDVCTSSSLIKSLGYDYVDGVDSQGIAGGLWVGWNKSVTFHISFKKP